MEFHEDGGREENKVIAEMFFFSFFFPIVFGMLVTRLA